MSVEEVGGDGTGSGFIQVVAERWGLKSIGLMGGAVGRK